MHPTRAASLVAILIPLLGCASAPRPPGVSESQGSGGSGGSDDTVLLNGGGSGGALPGGGGGAPGTGGDSGPAPLGGAGASAPTAGPTGPAWYEQIGGPLDEESTAMTLDHDANVIVAGTSQGTTDFGGGPTELLGTTDLFVARYDATGAYQWARRFGSGTILPTDVAADGAGDVFVLGQYTGGPIALGAEPLGATGPLGSDFFVLALDAQGNTLWSRRLEGASDAQAGRIAVGADGRVVVAAGYAYDQLVLAELSAQGDTLFSHVFGADTADVGGYAPVGAVRIDANGDVFITGMDGGHATFGGGSPSAVTAGVYVAKYSGADGAYLWSRQYQTGDNGDDVAEGTGLVIVGDDIVIRGLLRRRHRPGRRLRPRRLRGAGGLLRRPALRRRRRVSLVAWHPVHEPLHQPPGLARRLGSPRARRRRAGPDRPGRRRLRGLRHLRGDLRCGDGRLRQRPPARRAR